ncbi:hypothetical protein V1477_001743 [Vespula maculifrons]|uniref:Uncharacterized protein n=3 Tax=Vespula TaxID=7451 RepID=A0A834PD20_VESPE|nr:hypothetical protein HZH66_000040 [Vespula vulgaris]KAF7437656.1 hypothetical protein H0235_000047 [Vespula pensylvanica]
MRSSGIRRRRIVYCSGAPYPSAPTCTAICLSAYLPTLEESSARVSTEVGYVQTQYEIATSWTLVAALEKISLSWFVQGTLKSEEP